MAENLYELTSDISGLITARDLAVTAFMDTLEVNIQNAINSLSSVSIEGGSIEYSFTDLPALPTLETPLTPETIPTALVETTITEPSEVVDLGIILTAPVIPEIGSSVGVEVIFSWAEEYYSSESLTALLASLQTGLTTGSGIAESLQAALILVGTSKLTEAQNEELAKANAYFSERSIDAPSGVLSSRASQINAKYARLNAEMLSNVTAEVLKLEHEYRKHCQLAASQLENMLITYSGSYADRALQGEKTKWELIVAAFNTGVARLGALVEYAKLSVDAELGYMNGLVRLEEAKTGIVSKRWDVFKTKVEAQSLKLSRQYDGYVAKTGALSSYNNSIASVNSSQSSFYEAASQVAIAKGIAIVKAQEANIASILKSAEVLVQALQASGQIASNAYAAAMNSINMGATMNAGVSSSSSHSYDETKGELPGMSVSKNYNISGEPGS